MKEVAFEVRGDAARSRIVECILGSKTLVSESLSFHVGEPEAWELHLLRGDEREVAEFRKVLREPPGHLTTRVEEVQGGPTWVAFYWEFRRPGEGQGVSVPHLFQDHLKGRGTLRHRIGPRKGDFSVLGFDGDALARFYRDAELGFRDFYDIRLVRMGEPRLGPCPTRTVPLEDLVFAREAMRMGYFEEPRRVGVRELGGLAGTGKSATAHRLRRIERRAVEALLENALGSAALPCPGGPEAPRPLPHAPPRG